MELDGDPAPDHDRSRYDQLEPLLWFRHLSRVRRVNTPQHGNQPTVSSFIPDHHAAHIHWRPSAQKEVRITRNRGRA